VVWIQAFAKIYVNSFLVRLRLVEEQFTPPGFAFVFYGL
jgi:hypothetical protein